MAAFGVEDDDLNFEDMNIQVVGKKQSKFLNAIKSIDKRRIDDDDDALNIPSDSNSEDEDVDAKQHSKFLNAIKSIGKKKKIVDLRTELSSKISEFQLGKVEETDKINIKELVRSLGQVKGVDEVKSQILDAYDKRKTVKTPLLKPEAEKIIRSISYGKVNKDVSKWQKIVYQNRLAENVHFPLVKPDLRLQPAAEYVKKFKPSTPLEMQVTALLQNSDNVLKDEEEFSAAEQRILNSVSLEEAELKRIELQKMRALITYKAANLRRQAKVKSKNYHRHLKHRKIKEELKNFEELKKKDPEAAARKLKQLNLLRITERMTLKHKNTGKWAKQHALRRKYDKTSRDAMLEQLQLNKDLTRKVYIPSSSEDEAEPPPNSEAMNIRELDFKTFQNHLLAKVNPWFKNSLTKDIQSTKTNFPNRISVPSTVFEEAILQQNIKDKNKFQDEKTEDFGEEIFTIKAYKKGDSSEFITNNQKEILNPLEESSSFFGEKAHEANKQTPLSKLKKSKLKKKNSIKKGDSLLNKKKNENEEIVIGFEGKDSSAFLGENTITKLKKPKLKKENSKKKESLLNKKKDAVFLGGNLDETCKQTSIIKVKKSKLKNKKAKKNDKIKNVLKDFGEKDINEDDIDDIFEKIEFKRLKEMEKVEHDIKNAVEIVTSNKKKNAAFAKSKGKDIVKKKRKDVTSVVAETNNSEKNVKLLTTESLKRKRVKEDTNESLNKNTTESNFSTRKDYTEEHQKSTEIVINPDKVIIKPKKMRSKYVDHCEEGDEEEKVKLITIAEAFSDLDIVREFQEEKQAIEEKNKPKDIDLTLPGWGTWTGINIPVPSPIKKKFVIKVPKGPPRKDQHLSHVIINETKSTDISKHQVNQLPYPFQSIKTFEKTIRAPLGSTWNTEIAVRKLTIPKLSTAAGAIIPPLDPAHVFEDEANYTSKKQNN